MYIKFAKMKVIKKGRAELYELMGWKQDGTEYTKTFPTWTDEGKELAEQIDGFKDGQWLDIKYDMKADYKPIKTIEAIDKPPEDSGYKGGGGNKGGGKSQWNGRTAVHHNRASAMYLAYDMVKDTLPAKEKKEIKDVTEQVIEVADVLFKYLEEGPDAAYAHNRFGGGVNPPEGDGADTLSPPDLDD